MVTKEVNREAWEKIVDSLAAKASVLLGLWAEKDRVRMCTYDQSAGVTVVMLRTPQGSYPSVARKHLPALRMERAIADLFGLKAEGCPDTRPWLDHGKWPVRTPFVPVAASGTPVADYTFLPVEGEGLHQIPVGPIHAGIIEPGHFRFSANGETVVRLEERLGYVHKGVEKLFEGADLATAAKLAGRISGDSTVAYAFAFARAVESALDINVPPRAQGLRGIMAELERIANHFGDIGAICNDASFSLMHAHCGILREENLQLANACFGHRLMMDRIVPGGVAADLGAAEAVRLLDWTDSAEKRFDELMRIYEDTASLKNRTHTTGIVSEELVQLYGTGGFIGRASGRRFDARHHVPYPPYDTLEFDIPVLKAGDVHTRVLIRAHEVKQSLALIREIVRRLPQGGLIAALPPAAAFAGREGIAQVEGFRGDVLIWLRFDDDGRIARCYSRDPSWFQWPLLEVAIKGNIVADFPLCNKSFNCSYSGHDL